MGIGRSKFVWDDPIGRWDSLGMLDSVTMSIPQLIAQGWTAKEIAQFTGISLAVAVAMVEADKLEKTAQNLVRNLSNNSGRDPCEKAKIAIERARKGIQKVNGLIEKHKGYISNPNSYPNLDPTVVAQQGGLITSRILGLSKSQSGRSS